MNPDIGDRPLFCKHCDSPVEKINFTGTAGKGDPRPYKHKGREYVCSRETLSEKDVTTSPAFDYP